MFFLFLLVSCSFGDELLSVPAKDTSSAERKYLLYDVNRGEGFNLRRDVFMRVANTVRVLREKGNNYILVLPPWGGLYHWKHNQLKLPWSLFFDIDSIAEFVPVIEFEQFLKETNNDNIDKVIYLQGYVEGWTSGDYEIKFDKRDCIDGNRYYELVDGKWRSWFFGYRHVSALEFSCISIQGDSSTLVRVVESEGGTLTSLFIDRAEAILHEHFGDVHYWEARRSMRYAHHLVQIGDQFRKERLDSTDDKDRTHLGSSWKLTKKNHGDALGGNFLCVHWRRRDFLHSHSADVPSIRGTAQQISKILQKENLSTVFLSTDAPAEEVQSLKKILPDNIRIEQYVANNTLTDGEVSIIDQWICAHARYFTGTHTSTFSYRIQEDREIFGFKPESTFNRLCPDNEDPCEQPAKWTIVYDGNSDEFY